MRRMTKLLVVCFAGSLALTGFTGCGKKAVSTKSSKWENITVLPVSGIPEDFVMGVDISSLVSVEAGGAKFYDAEGKQADPIDLLVAGGANTARIRIWNNPATKDGKTYGGGANDIDVACKIGKRATKAGMGVMIDFHYSDFWADPNKQRAPKAWEKFSLKEKQDAIYEFTTDCLKKLKSAGVNVTMVQSGNEINNGICGEIYDREVASLVNAGAKAVRDFDPSIKIIVHYTDPLSEGYLAHKAGLLEKYKVDYDILGTSYYPYWHGDVNKLSITLRKVANLSGKKVMVCEVSYPFTDDDGDGFGNVVSTMSANQEFKYPFTVEGQSIAVRDVIEAVAKVKNAGVGVCYWEPAWIPPKVCKQGSPDLEANYNYNKKCWEENGSGWATWAAREFDKEVKSEINGGTWDNQAFFDFNGKVMDSINVWNYARTGSKGPIKVVRVENPRIEFAYGKKGVLPETAKVTYNDGSVVDEPVEWNKKMAEKVTGKPDFGEYEVPGKTKNNDRVMCTVNVTASNFLVNGNFEKGSLEGWNVENPLGKGSPKVDKNNQNAKEGLCYATGWEADKFDFTIWQELKDIDYGTYKCFASFEGTGVKNPSGSGLKVTINRKDGTKTELKSDATVPNEWKKFYKCDIPAVKVDETVSSIVVSIRMAAEFDKSGANGAWLVCDDVNFLFVE